MTARADLFDPIQSQIAVASSFIVASQTMTLQQWPNLGADVNLVAVDFTRVRGAFSGGRMTERGDDRSAS